MEILQRRQALVQSLVDAAGLAAALSAAEGNVTTTAQAQIDTALEATTARGLADDAAGALSAAVTAFFAEEVVDGDTTTPAGPGAGFVDAAGLAAALSAAEGNVTTTAQAQADAELEATTARGLADDAAGALEINKGTVVLAETLRGRADALEETALGLESTAANTDAEAAELEATTARGLADAIDPDALRSVATDLEADAVAKEGIALSSQIAAQNAVGEADDAEADDLEAQIARGLADDAEELALEAEAAQQVIDDAIAAAVSKEGIALTAVQTASAAVAEEARIQGIQDDFEDLDTAAGRLCRSGSSFLCRGSG